MNVRAIAVVLIGLLASLAGRAVADMRADVEALGGGLGGLAQNRSVGTEGAANAADYLAQRLAATGQTVYRQAFFITVPVVEECTAAEAEQQKGAWVGTGRTLTIAPLIPSGGQAAAAPTGPLRHAPRLCRRRHPRRFPRQRPPPRDGCPQRLFPSNRLADRRLPGRRRHPLPRQRRDQQYRSSQQNHGRSDWHPAVLLRRPGPGRTHSRRPRPRNRRAPPPPLGRPPRGKSALHPPGKSATHQPRQLERQLLGRPNHPRAGPIRRDLHGDDPRLLAPRKPSTPRCSSISPENFPPRPATALSFSR